MGVAVLHPEDCLNRPFPKQTIISPPHMRHPKNSYPIRTNRAQTNRRKPPQNASPPTRTMVDQKKLVMGQIKILKRGEELTKSAAKPAKTEKNSADLNLGSTNRLGPDPELVPTQIRLTESKNKISAFYAGSAFFTSPPPSSVPLPAFFTKKSVVAVKNDDATSDLRRILRLDL